MIFRILLALSLAALAVAPRLASATEADAAARLDRLAAADRATQLRALAGLGVPVLPGGAADFAEDGPPAPRPEGDGAACRVQQPQDIYRQRLRSLGEGHPYLERWRQAQQAVYSHCDGAGAPRPLPPELPALPPVLAVLQRADRAYQQAAILFYDGEAAGARDAFRAIAADSASPHRPFAAYMAVEMDKQPLNAASAPAEVRRVGAEAEAILADPGLAPAHPLAQGALGWIAWHTGDAAARQRHLAALLPALLVPAERLRPGSAAADRYARALLDLAQQAPAGLPTLPPTGPEALLLSPPSRFDGGAWSAAYAAGGLEAERSAEAAATAHAAADPALALAWHVEAVSHATDYDPAGWDEIDRLAARIAAASRADTVAEAALPRLLAHRLRTAVMPDRSGTRHVQAALDALARYPFPHSRHLQAAAVQALRLLAAEGALPEARRLRDRLLPLPGAAAAIGSPLAMLLAEDEDRLAASLDAGNPWLDALPTGALHRLSQRIDLAPCDRARLARRAWLRSFVATGAVPAAWDAELRATQPLTWASATGAQRRGDLALSRDLLATAGFQLTGEREACTPEPAVEHRPAGWSPLDPARLQRRSRHALAQALYAADTLPRGARSELPAESWLAAHASAAELAALAAAPSGAKLLAGDVTAAGARLGWFDSRDGLDDALALAVAATRSAPDAGAESHAAFVMLHRMFPGSAAAQATPYWFDGQAAE